MKVIDARSGKVMQPGETVWWDTRTIGMDAEGNFVPIGPQNECEGVTFHGLIRGGWWKPVADLTIYGPRLPGGSQRVQAPLLFRLTHPKHFLQPVAYIST